MTLQPVQGDAFERMTRRRVQHWIFRLAPTLRAFWRAEARTEAGLNDLRAEAIQTQAEMFVRNVVGRTEPGMTWRLAQIEEEMGFADGKLLGLSDDERRSRILARLRSWRIPTAQTMRSIAQAYAGNDAQFIMDYEGHNITIRFVGNRLPENLAELEAELTRVMPARLGPIHFVIDWPTWGDVYEVVPTWRTLLTASADVGPVTWEWLYMTPRQDLPTGVVRWDGGATTWTDVTGNWS